MSRIVGLSWIAADLPAEASDPTLGTADPVQPRIGDRGHPRARAWSPAATSPRTRARTFLRPLVSALAGPEGLRRLPRDAARPSVPRSSAVVTPDHLHRDVVEVAIENGARGIFCEKPIATTLEDADAIVAAARGAGVTVNVNYTRRWFPEFVEARRLVRSGAIGRLSQIVIEMGGPRSMLFRNHTHGIDIVNYLADSPAVWVWAELERGFEDYGTAYAGDGGNDPATEPGANYYIAYENGVRAYATGIKDTAVPDTVAAPASARRAGSSSTCSGIRLLLGLQRGHPRTKPNVPTIQPITPRWIGRRDAGGRARPHHGHG